MKEMIIVGAAGAEVTGSAYDQELQEVTMRELSLGAVETAALGRMLTAKHGD